MASRETVSIEVDVIGEVEFSDGDYRFDTLRVISIGRQLYYAEDAGCSCPIPFDAFAIRGETDPSKGYVAASKHEIAARINERLAEYGDNPREYTKSTAMTLIERLMA